MQIKIQNGIVDLSGTPILKKIDIEINTESKIGIVGRNGCGKTTLLRLLSGELSLSKDNPDHNSQYIISGKPIIGTLNQMAFKDNSVTLLDEIRNAYSEILVIKEEMDSLQRELESNSCPTIIERYSLLMDTFTNLGGFYFEKEYEAALKRFGFTDEDKKKPLSDFSGGQRTKIAFLKLLLSKPDLLLLDEPTNHLDIDAVTWLEEYLQAYKKAVVIVSHDRMFLDKTVNTIYEIEHGKTNRYAGNYSQFAQQKKIIRELQKKAYEEQQEEIKRLNELIEKFRYKANKAAMVQSKIKYLERMELVEPPESYDSKQFHADFEPDLRSAKDILTVRNLEIGYTHTISTVNLNVERGQHIGIIGGNGLGKSTFLKTIVGILPSLGGNFLIGNNVKIGYFDQQMAQYSSEKTVLDDFLDEFPTVTSFEARSSLGAFLFSGDDVYKTVNMLSGGEKVRLALCKLFKKKPNFLILDEPTNHMDIVGKEALENMLADYSGTLLFVSHDRYFVKKVAERIVEFNRASVNCFNYGYDDYVESKSKAAAIENLSIKTETPKQKKTYTTPAKEKAKRERAIKKCENLIEELETKLAELNSEIGKPEVFSDYVRLSELQQEISETEEQLLSAMEEWESLSE
ncbi:MAG: ABC-F family ATP-binding cassette domain-containing protein [Clostridia bacterium]|nr:ABC-F family ATP-binding cassette domain-containing protein [Clostridia bacterium]